MKATSSSRSLTNGSSTTHSARATMASPLATGSSMPRSTESGKKARRGTLDKPPGMVPATQLDGSFPYRPDGLHPGVGAPQDLLLQLQQFQQQQQLHQHSMATAAGVAFGYPSTASIQPMPTGYMTYMAQPPAMQRIPSQVMAAPMVDDPSARHLQYSHSGASNGSNVGSSTAVEEEGDLMGRIEKKDQMIAQLGSFLSQMKQESEGTAHAWKEKMLEIGELKRQVAALTQQLNGSQKNEKKLAAQLAQVTEDVELAVQGLKESEAKHLEELKIMNDEIQRRQSEEQRVRTEHDDTVRRLQNEIATYAHQVEDESRQRHLLESALENMDIERQALTNKVDEQHKEAARELERSQAQYQSVEKEKQELAQHLWNVTQAYDQAANQVRSLQSDLESASKTMEQSSTEWSDRIQKLQAEKNDLLNTRASLQKDLEDLHDKVQVERQQKEQINALMAEEMQRIGHEINGIHQQYNAKLDQNLVEIEHWKNEATSLQEKIVRIEGQYVLTRKELDEWQDRASHIDEEFQILQKSGTEKACTLQELNERLHNVLKELHDTRQRSEQLQQRCEALEAGIAQCIHHLPERQADADDKPVDSFPANVLIVLNEWKQQAGHMEQIKVSMLRLQQDRDNERERFRVREQDLLQKALHIQTELEAAKADATTLAQELQEMTQRVGGNETKLAAHVQQLTKDLDESRSDSAIQILQLQKTMDSLKVRIQQLEAEKRDLLQEAESMNATVESLYQVKNEKQVELDQLKATWKELQAEHADLKESMNDLETNYEQTTTDLNQRAKELQQLVQSLMSAKELLEKENASFNDTLAKLKADFESVHRQYTADQTKWGDQDRELRQALEEKSRRLEEMMEMLTQLRSRNEFLEQARATDDHNARGEFDKYQQQLITLGQEKKRIEIAFASAKTQLDQVLPELFTLKEEKRHFSQTQSDLEEEIGNIKSEVVRLQGEVERSSRARSALQLELNRVTDEGQNVVRQFEVLRRDAKANDKHYQDETDRLKREIEELRNEGIESAAMMEELQTKMTSVQNAANATINELMSELQNLQDTMGYDKSKFQKENETLKAQLRTVEEDLRKKDADVKEIQGAYRQEKDHFVEKENELMMKINRLTSTLESKKHDVDRLSKDLESKGLKVAEYERKLNPLINAKDNMQAKCNELKAALDAKARESQDLEERYRDEVGRAIKEKRDVETMYMAMKEDFEMIKSQSNGQQQQWQSDFRAMKHNLEKTKADLMKANAEVLALTQRLESYQQTAQETVTDLATRLQGADQQKELVVNALQREINLERERRREAEVQKMELQRLLRQRGATQVASSPGYGAVVASGSQDDGIGWSLAVPTPSSQRQQPSASQDHYTPARGSSAPEALLHSPPKPAKELQSSTPPEYRKFYANEPMTNAELANLPMNLIKAQIGLDMATKSPSKTMKNATRGFSKSPGDNNEEIPMLAFDKLPQDPEAHDDDSSPTCDSSRSTRQPPEKRSGAATLLDSLSARSTSDRYLMDSIDVSNRPQRNASNSSLNSSNGIGSNNKKKQPSTKKKRPSIMPSTSSAAAAAYGSFSSAPAPTPSPPKMKSNSKLLPRIQQ